MPDRSPLNDESPGLSRHRCLIYNGAAGSLFPVIAPFFVKGLQNAERCLYLGDAEAIAELCSALGAAGVDVEAETKKGALVVSSEKILAADGSFDPALMLAKLEEAVDRALSDGHRGLRATGDILWEFDREENLDALLTYEVELQKIFIQKKELVGICQYNRRLLPSRCTRDALLSHRSVYTGDVLKIGNPFYLPPDLFRSSYAPHPAIQDALADWMWQEFRTFNAGDKID